MSDTPRTDAIAEDGCSISPDFARKLERELNEMKLRLGLRFEEVATHSSRCHLWHIDCANVRLEKAWAEIDQWKQCAEHLASVISEGEEVWHNDRTEVSICNDSVDAALSRFNKLKGQTK